MTPRSCLRDPTVTVIADTSVVINLHATGCAETILEALPNRFFVVSQVLDELETDRRTGRNDAGAIAASVASGRITVVQLGDAGRGSFLNLVSGSAARTLDDGEAATIASCPGNGTPRHSAHRRAKSQSGLRRALSRSRDGKHGGRSGPGLGSGSPWTEPSCRGDVQRAVCGPHARASAPCGMGRQPHRPTTRRTMSLASQVGPFDMTLA